MSEQQSNDPLHGVTLEEMVNSLVAYFGWEGLGKRINIKCFNSDPSVNSSLKFLRKTPWARKKVESLYLAFLKYDRKKSRKN
ncbi:MAG: VF530 family protein [Proteobacteria bacterium]|nr:VF530 family protein [Pseudomonadota bacterium]MBU1709301.1 VF530 family protein [Pseudomonadota bacterium]